MPTIETVYMAGAFVRPGKSVQDGDHGFPVLMTREQRDEVLASSEAAHVIGAYVLDFLREQAPDQMPDGSGEFSFMLLNLEANPTHYAEVVEQIRSGRGSTRELLAVDVTSLILDHRVDGGSSKVQ